MSTFGEVRSRGNKIAVFGDLRLGMVDKLISHIYGVVHKDGYTDVVFDFQNVTSVTSSVVAPFCAYLSYLRQEYKADFEHIPSRLAIVNNRFSELGIDYFIDPSPRGRARAEASGKSVSQFLTHNEREAAVDRVINNCLRKVSLGRQHVAALDWAINEITDNVISHSKSKIGGFLIWNKLSNRNIIEFTVADAGYGIAKSLGLVDDAEAVEKSIQEGVTRNKTTNQGNGLFGTYRLALTSAGVFVLKSRSGNLFVTKDGDMHVRRDAIPFPGTFLVCQIDCNRPDLIEQALVFAGRAHTPSFDYVERHHEANDQRLTPLVSAKDICKTFGSRKSGSEARQYIRNILSMGDDGRIEIDFSDVHVVSSSFADEVFGKLFVELGPMNFMRSIKVKNVTSTVELLIDRAITLRSQTGL